MRKKEAIILKLLLFLFIVFFARGPFYAENTLFSSVITVLFLGISSLYLVKSLLIRNKNGFFYYYWLLLLSLNIIGFIFTAEFSNKNHSAMFISIIVAALPFFSFFYFSKKGLLKEKHLIWISIFLLPVFIAKYYYTELLILSDHSFSITGITNNSGYYFASLIPFLFLFRKKKILSYMFLFIILFYIISSAKRGAILVGIIGTFCFLYFQLRSANRKELFITILLVFVATVALIYFGYEYIQNNEYLLARWEATSSGDSSGRDIIYKNIFYSWFNTHSLVNLIFGFGFAASLELSTTGHFAHNDWLELLSNFGLIGLIVYSLLIFSLYSFTCNSSIYKNKKTLLITILLMWLIVSIFSMVYTSAITAIQSLLLGYLIGSENKSEIKIK